MCLSPVNRRSCLASPLGPSHYLHLRHFADSQLWLHTIRRRSKLGLKDSHKGPKVSPASFGPVHVQYLNRYDTTDLLSFYVAVMHSVTTCHSEQYEGPSPVLRVPRSFSFSRRLQPKWLSITAEHHFKQWKVEGLGCLLQGKLGGSEAWTGDLLISSPVP